MRPGRPGPRQDRPGRRDPGGPAHLRLPPGSPQRPPTADELDTKVGDCLAGTDLDPSAIAWADAADILRRWF